MHKIVSAYYTLYMFALQLSLLFVKTNPEYHLHTKYAEAHIHIHTLSRLRTLALTPPIMSLVMS